MRYFFDLLDGSLQRDHEGLDCEHLETAKKHAAEVLRSKLPTACSDWPRIAILVRDEASRPCFKAVVRAEIEFIEQLEDFELVWA